MSVTRSQSLAKIATSVVFATSVVAFLASTAVVAPAQVSINIGSAPECPYGYFDYAPYNCAPYGYYGPDWFANGIFIGAGPWYHGRQGWYGHVDNRLTRAAAITAPSTAGSSRSITFTAMLG